MGRTTKTNKAQATQTQQAQAPAYVTMDALEVMLKALKNDIVNELKGSSVGETPKAQPVAQPKADKDGKVAFTKKDGTVVYGTPKQVAQWERWSNRNLTEGQKATVETIKASKAAEPERTRKLEKLMGLKANTLENTAVSVKVALEKGWKPKASDRKGRKDELKALKAKVRG